MRIVIDLAGTNEATAVQALKWLLKRLGRDFGLRCTGVKLEPAP